MVEATGVSSQQGWLGVQKLQERALNINLDLVHVPARDTVRKLRAGHLVQQQEIFDGLAGAVLKNRMDSFMQLTTLLPSILGMVHCWELRDGRHFEGTLLHVAAAEAEPKMVRAILHIYGGKEAPGKLFAARSFTWNTPRELSELLDRTEAKNIIACSGVEPKHRPTQGYKKDGHVRVLQQSFGDCYSAKVLDVRNLSEGVLYVLNGKSDEVNRRDEWGQTLLHWAAQMGQNSVDLLVAAGADTDAPDFKGETPLHHAARYSATQVERFLAVGADVNARSRKGETPLRVAVEGKPHSNNPDEKYNIVRKLVEAGADPKVTDWEGKTSLSVAMTQEDERMVGILRHSSSDGPRVKRRKSEL